MFRQRGGVARPNQRRGGGSQGPSGGRFNHGNNRSNGSNHGNQKRGGGGGGRGGHHHTAGQKRGRQSYEDEEGEDEDVDEEEYDEEDDTKTKVKSTSREYDLSAALAAHASDDEDDGPSEYQQLMNSLRGNSSVAAASKKSSTETLSQKHAALLAKRKKEEEGREEEADEEEEEGEEEDAEMDYEDDEDEEGMEGEEDDEEEMDEDAEEEAEDDEDDQEQDARGPSKKRRVQTSEDGEEGEEGEVYEDEEGEDDEDEEIEPIEGDDQLSEEDSDDSDNEADSGKKGSSSKEAADHAAKEMQEPDLFYRKFSHGHVFTPSQTTLLNLDGNAFAKRFPFKRGPAVPGMSEMLFVAGEENLRTPMPLNETTAAISPAKPTLSPPTAPPTPLLPASMKEDFVQTVRSVSDESLRILPKLQETWKRFIVESRRKKLNKKAKRDGSSATKKSSYELELEREKELDEINQENNKAAEEESASAVAGESTSTSSSGSLTQATSKFCAPDCLCFLCSDFYSASQSNILSILTNYQDLILTNTTPLQAQTVHEALALHMVNHLTKSREQVLRHNLKISKAEKKEKDRKDELRKAKREWREDMNRYRAQQKQNKAGGEAEEASDEEAKSSASSKKQKKQLSAKKQAPLVAPPSTVPHSDPLPIPEYRDQGFTRPKILALFPTAKVAHEFVLKLLALTPAKNKAIQVKRKRFDGDFAYNAAVDGPSVDPSKPFDYKYYFDGKDNDAFRVGINFNMKSVQFYAPFYNSDIIIASPLGLRMITGSEGDKITEREYDFLSSIEMLYVDSFDVVASMQNLQHLLTVMELLNTIPFKTSYTDFARIREWNLNGTAKYQRQTIVCAAHPQVELQTFQKNYCRNVEGKFMTRLAYQGVLNRVIPAVKQIFQRIHCEKLTELPEARFDYFITTVLPQLKASYPDGHILLYIPSYFDYVRVRNYAKAKHLNAAYASEYTKNSELSRGRSAFFHGEKKFMLITERFHFFKRYRIRGTVHVVFYALPTYEQFYVDFVNLLPSSGSGTMSAQSGSVLALYSKFDSQELERIIGTQRATKLLQATNHTHMFC